MDKFDYDAPAELFPSRNKKVGNRVRYRRFERAADAIRFAVEELPDALLLGATIQLENQRLSHREIRTLYESDRYPLKKLKKAS